MPVLFIYYINLIKLDSSYKPSTYATGACRVHRGCSSCVLKTKNPI